MILCVCLNAFFQIVFFKLAYAHIWMFVCFAAAVAAAGIVAAALAATAAAAAAAATTAAARASAAAGDGDRFQAIVLQQVDWVDCKCAHSVICGRHIHVACSQRATGGGIKCLF